MRNTAHSTTFRRAALAAAAAAALMAAALSALLQAAPQPAQAQGSGPYQFASADLISPTERETKIRVMRIGNGATTTLTFSLESQEVNGSARGLLPSIAEFSVETSDVIYAAGQMPEPPTGFGTTKDMFGRVTSFTLNVNPSIASFDLTLTRHTTRDNNIVERDYQRSYLILTTGSGNPPSNTNPQIEVLDNDSLEIQLFAVDENPPRRITAEAPLVTKDGVWRDLELRLVGGVSAETFTLTPNLSRTDPMTNTQVSDGRYAYEPRDVVVPDGEAASARFRLRDLTADLVFHEDEPLLFNGNIRSLNTFFLASEFNRLGGRTITPLTHAIRSDKNNPNYLFRKPGDSSDNSGRLDPITLTEGGTTPLLRLLSNDIRIPSSDVILTVVGATPADAAQIETTTSVLVGADLSGRFPDNTVFTTAVGFLDDSVYNGTRVVNLAIHATATSSNLLAGPDGFTSETLPVTVLDNDTPIVQVTEIGQDANGVHFRVEAAGGSPRILGELTVAFQIDTPSAFSSSTPDPNSVTIPAGGESATVTITLQQDNTVAAMRNPISFTIQDDPNSVYQIAAGRASARQTANDPDIPEFGFRDSGATSPAGTIMVAEGGRTRQLQAYISNGVTIDADVTLTPRGTTQLNQALLASTQPSVVIPSGMSASSSTFSVAVADNNIYQGGAQVSIAVGLSASAPNGIFSNPASFQVTPLTLSVTDNDDPRLQVVPAGQDRSAARFRVQPPTGAPSIGAELRVDFAATAPADLLAGALPTFINFMAGEESATIEIPLQTDGVYNAPRNATVTLDGSALVYDVAGDPAQQAVADPDMPLVRLGNPAAVDAEQEGGTQDLVVLLDTAGPSLNADLQIGLDLDDPARTLTLPDGGGDVPGSVTIPSGQSSTTLTLQIVDDETYEGGMPQVATVGLQASTVYGFSPATATVTTLTISVPDDDAPRVDVDQQSRDVDVVTEGDGTQVLQVGENRTVELAFQTNYPPGTVLNASLSAGGASHLELIAQSVTVGPDGRVTVQVRTASVARPQDVRLTLAAPSAPPMLAPIVQQIRVDNDADIAPIFFPTVPQTGGAEPGAWLWLLASFAAALLAAGALLARRRAAA